MAAACQWMTASGGCWWVGWHLRWQRVRTGLRHLERRQVQREVEAALVVLALTMGVQQVQVLVVLALKPELQQLVGLYSRTTMPS